MPSKLADLRFVVDATVESGFGHVARCLKLVELVSAVGQRKEILFQGTFSAGARGRVSAALGEDRIMTPDAPIQATVSVIDRMSDAVDINAWDQALTERIACSSGRTIAIFSGDKPPRMPPDVIALGYQPIDGDAPEGWLWSLDYAPVGSDFVTLPNGMERWPEAGRLLIAMGGSAETTGITEAMTGALRTPVVENIDVLMSPLSVGSAEVRASFDSPRVNWLSQVEDIRPLLMGAHVVLTSYGNLGFEALALGCPVCFLAQKPFQERMAERMAARGVATNAGISGVTHTDAIVSTLSHTFARADELSRNALQLIDGRGLDRIRDIILREFEIG